MVQMLFVLLIVGVMTSLIPTANIRALTLKYDCQKVKAFLLAKQQDAIFNKSRIEIVITTNKLISEDKNLQLSEGMNCGEHSISFNQRGNVNQARTIACEYFGVQRNVVINLGSGNVYVQ